MVQRGGALQPRGAAQRTRLYTVNRYTEIGIRKSLKRYRRPVTKISKVALGDTYER